MVVTLRTEQAQIGIFGSDVMVDESSVFTWPARNRNARVNGEPDRVGSPLPEPIPVVARRRVPSLFASPDWAAVVVGDPDAVESPREAQKRRTRQFTRDFRAAIGATKGRSASTPSRSKEARHQEYLRRVAVGKGPNAVQTMENMR